MTARLGEVSQTRTVDKFEVWRGSTAWTENTMYFGEQTVGLLRYEWSGITFTRRVIPVGASPSIRCVVVVTQIYKSSKETG